MAKSREPAGVVKCFICEKKINIDQKRKFKKVNGSGRTSISKARQLLNKKWVCSDACFNLADGPPNEPLNLDPE